MCKDPQKAKQLYDSIECLQPQNIADSILYVLSTPPHVDVSLNVYIFLFIT